jgi:ferredoxin
MQKVVVKKESCIGCGLCVSSNPDYFEFNDEGLSVVIKEELNLEDKPRILDSVENCPTEAIVIEEEKIAE